MNKNKSARLLFKTITFSFVVISLNIISFVSVSALRFDPEKIENNKLDYIEINIYSTYTNTAEGVSINFKIQNGTILDYQPVNVEYISLGTCDDNGNTFTDDKVCIDTVSKLGINNGDKLGVLTIALDQNNEALIIPSNIRYINHKLKEEGVVEGVLGVYSNGVTTINPQSTLSVIEDVIVTQSVIDSTSNANVSANNNFQINSNMFVIVSLIIFVIMIVGAVYILKKSNNVNKTN